jgi:hypothetical protein
MRLKRVIGKHVNHSVKHYGNYWRNYKAGN